MVSPKISGSESLEPINVASHSHTHAKEVFADEIT